MKRFSLRDRMSKLKMPKFITSNERIKSIDAPKGWLIKAVVFGALLTGAGCFMGFVLKWVGGGYEHFIPGSWDLGDALRLGFWAIGAIATVALTAGLVAILVRPFWVAALEMLASALALFLCWDISLVSFVVALIYFLAGLLYLAGVRTEISNRIQFRVWNIRTSQGVLLALLVALVCTSLYFGYAGSINRDGFTLSPEAINWILTKADHNLLDKVLPEGYTDSDKTQALDTLQHYLEKDVTNDMQQYKSYAPALLAAGVFSVLMLAVSLISWVPLLIMWLAFLILLRLKVIKKKAHPVEVTRLSIE
jgi:hypothetical protein